MRKVRLFIASSLDGFIARKNHSIDWLFMDGDYGYKKFYSQIDTVILGRKTFDIGKKLGQPYFEGKRNIVFTRKSLKGKNVEFSQDIVGTVRKLQKEKGKGIWLVGGGEIISVLMQNGLVGEISVSIHPIVLGSGIPLFKKVKETKLRLKNSVIFKNGLVQLWYDVN